jgi:Ca2+-binding RTX toxin-like protein
MTPMPPARADARHGRLALIACATALLALPAAAEAAGTVTTDGSRVTYTGTPANDSVLAAYSESDDELGGAPSVVIVADSPLVNGSPGVCVQHSASPEQISCPRPSSGVLLDTGAGDDEAKGEWGSTYGPEIIRGGDGNDSLSGGSGDDQLDGGAGNDKFETVASSAEYRLGADTILGGSGEDAISYEGLVPVNVSLDGVADDGAAGEGDNVGTDVENVAGSSESDVLTGNESGNQFDGRAGADTIRGGGGDDLIQGGRHDDRLYGDGGIDDITGHHGDDFVEGGAGADRLSGDGCSAYDCYERAADTIQARDGERDLVTCGWNPDSVTADQADEVNSDCENVDRSGTVETGGDGPALEAAVSKKLRLGRVLAKGLPVKVSCDEACRLAASATVSRKTVAKGKKSLAAPGSTTVVLKFTKKARKQLARKKKVTLSVSIAATDSEGNKSAVRGKVTLKR